MRISDWSSDVCSSDLVGERLFERGAVTREDRGRLLDILQDAADARLILVVRQFGEPLGQRRQALQQLRRGVQYLTEAADAVRDHRLAGRPLVGDRRRALDRAVERDLRHAGEADAFQSGGGALKDRYAFVEFDAHADELRVVAPKLDLAQLADREDRKSVWLGKRVSVRGDRRG